MATDTLLQPLRVLLNIEKSVLKPGQKMEFLRVVLGLKEMSVFLPEEKVTKIEDMRFFSVIKFQ